MKAKPRNSREPLEKWQTVRDSTQSELASMNVRTIKLDSGAGQLSVSDDIMFSLIIKYCLFRLLSASL